MPANLDRCVKDLMAQGRDEQSAWAICRAALGESEYPEDATDADKLAALQALQTKESLSGLKEAANLGNWLEARFHSLFTSLADDLFGEGFMTRDERIALTSAISDALTAFNDSNNENIPQIFARRPFEELPDDAEGGEAAMQESEQQLALIESATSGRLLEAALRRDDTIGIKIIQPGQGSSGFYPAEVLERDGPKVFTSGLKMFWNHQTMTEEAERPEGDLRDLAAELVSDARWDANGPNGPGLYADAKVFKPYQEAVNELAPHIGVSIRAEGMAAPGPEGLTIQRIDRARSVDFVTEAGAGGEILQLFESYREQAHNRYEQQQPKEDDMDLKEAQERIAELEERDKQREEEASRLRESVILRDARDFVRNIVSQASLPDVTKERLMEQLSAKAPVKDGGLDVEALQEQVTNAIESETAYLRSVIGRTSPVKGMGASNDDSMQEAQAMLESAFSRITGSDSLGKIAATGR